MDLSLFLSLTMMSLSGLMVAMTLLHRPQGYAVWVAINLAVLAIGALALTYLPLWSPVLVAGIFMPFVVAPIILSGLSQRAANKQHNQQAATYARWAAALLPTAAMRFSSDLAAANAHDDPASIVQALRALADRSIPKRKAVVATLIATRQQQWDEVLKITASAPPGNPDMIALELRSLGELGRIREMVERYEAGKAALLGYTLLSAQLFLLAFRGRVQAVGVLLAHQLSTLAPEVKTYWTAVAELNCHEAQPNDTAAPGEATEIRSRGHERMERLAHDAKSVTVRAAAIRQLSARPSPEQPPLAPEALATIDTIEQSITRDAPLTRVGLREIPVTLTLMLLLSVMFAAEIWLGGSQNGATLVRLGALWPPLVIYEGEWWRLGTSALLHFGWVHVSANLFVLFVLGRLVETTQGWQRLLAGFVLGAVGSASAVLATMHWGYVAPAFLVGASGAIFTLFGLEVARQVRNWQRSRDILDRRRVIMLAVVMAVQFAIDVSVPQISLTAHLSGFTIGLILGFVWPLQQAGTSARAKI